MKVNANLKQVCPSFTYLKTRCMIKCRFENFILVVQRHTKWSKRECNKYEHGNVYPSGVSFIFIIVVIIRVPEIRTWKSIDHVILLILLFKSEHM